MAEHSETPSTRFAFTVEQQGLRELVRTFAERTFDDDTVRAQLEGERGYDATAWRALGSDLGVLGLALPEAVGGDDAGVVSLAVLAEELGRVLSGVPLVGSVALAGTVLAGCGRGDLVAGIVAGESVVSLVATDAQGRWAPAATGITASGGTLSGHATLVLDAATADSLVVVATSDDGPALFLVTTAASGLSATAQSTLDLTRRLARVDFADTPAERLDGDALELVERARDVAAVVLAAEAVGASERLLRSSVEYAGQRLQFGRAIGSFQGVKHRCADMYAAVEQSRSTAYHAAWTLDDPSLDDPRIAVDLATVETAGDYLAVAKNTVQVHGGIGFTWEHPTHLYYKRAVSDASLLGGRAAAAERLADAVLGTAS